MKILLLAMVLLAGCKAAEHEVERKIARVADKRIEADHAAEKVRVVTIMEEELPKLAKQRNSDRLSLIAKLALGALVTTLVSVQVTKRIMNGKKGVKNGVS